MVDYKSLYHIMVDASEKVIEQIERQNYAAAAEILKQGMQNAEDLYIELAEAKESASQKHIFVLLEDIKDVLEMLDNGQLSEAKGTLLAVAHCAEDIYSEISKKNPRASAE